VTPEDAQRVVAWIVEVCDPGEVICERLRIAWSRRRHAGGLRVGRVLHRRRPEPVAIVEGIKVSD